MPWLEGELEAGPVKPETRETGRGIGCSVPGLRRGRVDDMGQLERKLKVKGLPLWWIDPEQAWFWTRAWQQQECEADEDLAATRCPRVRYSRSGRDWIG